VGKARFVAKTDAARAPIRLWRSAAEIRDDRQLSVLVQAPSLEPHLQEAGETVLTVVADNPSGYADIARVLAARLTERSRVGDGELAALLVAIADGLPSTNRRIHADLDQVADLLEGSLDMGFGGVLDCDTGMAWPEAILDDWPLNGDRPDPEEDPDRYLYIPNEGSREAWEDMHKFASDVTDAAVRDRLLDAIDGKGAFSRFRRVLYDQDSLGDAWHAFSAESRAGRARQWLADAGFDAFPPPPLR